MSDPLPIHPPAEHTERPHAERSASQLKSLALCPGYKPENKSGKEQHWVTQQGIRGHDALEKQDLGDLQSDYEERLVTMCEDFCGTLPPAAVELREVRVDTIEGRWGYFDRLRFRGDRGSFLPIATDEDVIPHCTEADLVDYKFVKVKRPEDAEIALQGKDYVRGIFKQYPALQKITVYFLAPRLNFVTYHTFTREDLPRIELEIFAVLTQARKTDRKRASAKLFRPFYETCRFCSRKATCPALAGIAKQVYDRYLAEGAEPLPFVPANVHASQADDPATLGALKTLSGVMQPWGEAVDFHVTSKAIDEGKKVAGYEISFRKGRRSLTQPLTLLTVGPKYGIQMADVIEASKVSVAQLEDVVMAHAPRGMKEKTKNAFLDELRDADALTRGEESAVLTKTTKPDHHEAGN